ncbi:MAG: GntR family transcriptional regulator [Candidatus Protistobacter heckmanni]|nr:GntR family transcriptional regulator [Candidatus Protistobacter heckmanni]
MNTFVQDGPSDSALTPRALYEQVAERLRTRIFAHELAPGDWFDEQALATEYGISRTPLREALKVLAAEGLVTMRVRRGCYVTEVSQRDLDEIFQILALLEGQAAEDAALRATNTELLELRRMHQKLEEQAGRNDLDGFFQTNQAFHARVQEISGNRWLKAMIDDLRNILKLNRHKSLSVKGRLQKSLFEHREITAALETRDARRTGLLVREHLRNGRAAASETAAESATGHTADAVSDAAAAANP